MGKALCSEGPGGPSPGGLGWEERVCRSEAVPGASTQGEKILEDTVGLQEKLKSALSWPSPGFPFSAEAARSS